MLALHWFLPTGGDSRHVLPTADGRAPTHGYLAQVACACDQLGFDAVLTPCGTACEDAWISTASLIPLTRKLRFLVAFRPGLLSPTLAAQMASTYQRMSEGRLLVNIVVGAEPHEVARFGDFSDKATRYERTGEFLRIMRGAWQQEPLDFEGEHFRVEQATTRVAPQPNPEIYFGGASSGAEKVAAEHADVYLTWGETPSMVGERLDRMGNIAAEANRIAPEPLRFGIRFHVITRDTADEAWTEAARLLAGLDPAAVAAARADFATTASEGQRRMAELSGSANDNPSRSSIPDDPRELEIHPNVWAGVGLVRGGAGTVLVGSHAEVADRIEEYAALGIDEFILSGYPHLEEAWAVGDGLMPELRRRGRLPASTRSRPQPDVDVSMSNKVGVLICDHLDPEVAVEHGDYPELYMNMLTPLGIELRFYDLVRGELPQATRECDAWLTSGSRRTAYTDDEFIPDLVEFATATADDGVRHMGVCFGHQILGRALGATVEEGPEWGMGVRRWGLTRARKDLPKWMAAAPPSFALIASHRDQVTTIPDGAEVLAGADYCPIAAFRRGDDVFGVQGHPEFDARLSETLARRRRESVGDDIVDAALASLSTPIDDLLVARWIAEFLQPQRSLH